MDLITTDDWAAFNPEPVPVAPGPIYGPPPKPKDPQAKTVAGPYVIDPNTGTAAPITGLPRPHVLTAAEASANNLDPAASWQVDANGDYKKLGDAPTPGTPADKTQAAMDSTRNLVQSIERARGLVSNWSTGLGGAVGKMYPGSDQAKQLDSIVHQELRGNIFQNWVNGLKATSAQGTSGIGRIMQSEIPLVTGALGALDPVAMGRDETLNSFDQIEHRVLRSAALLNHENPDDPAVLQKYSKMFHAGAVAGAGMAPPSSGGGGGGPNGGGDTPPGISDLSADQKQAYGAFLAANPKPSGDQVNAFLSKLTGKTVTNGDDIAKAIAGGRGASSTVSDLTEQEKVRKRLDVLKEGGTDAGSAAAVGALDGITLGSADEINAFGNAVKGSLAGNGSFSDLYDVNVGANRALESELQQEHPWAYTGGQIGGGLILAPVGGGAFSEENTLAQLARAGAKSGAAFGGVYGFNSGEGVGGRLTGAVTGAGTGALVGALAPYAANKVATRISTGSWRGPRGYAPDLAQAADAEGVDLIRPMVDPASRGKFGALESAPGSQNMIRQGVDRTQGQIEGRVADLGEGGAALEPNSAGDTVKTAGLRYITQTGAHFNRQYGMLSREAAGVKIPATNATGQIDDILANLAETPNQNAKEIAYLTGLKEDLSKPLSIEAMRGLRTKIRADLARGDLTFGPAEGRVASIADAAAQDISQGLTAAGKGDLAARFKEVDGAYRDRMGMIGGTIQKLVGKRDQNLSGEQVFANLKSMAGPRGNASGLTRMLDQMTPEERTDVQATFADALGKNNKGEFSIPYLLSQTEPRKMPFAMRKALFGDKGAESIENLRLLASKLQEATGDVNRSKTAGALLRQMARNFIGSVTGLGTLGLGLDGFHGAATGVVAGAGIQAANLGRNMLSARALVNPRVSMWLARAADVSTPSQAKQAVKALSLVISREPAVAQELAPIRDFLNQRVTTALAAQPQGDDNEQR